MSSSKKAGAAKAAHGIASSSTTPGRCDLCTKKDGFQGMKLLRCRECGVCVHETCYGLPPSDDNDGPGHSSPSSATKWMCNACDAVGKTVVVSRKGHPIKTMKQTSRPTDCALCPVIDGQNVAEGVHPWHAMHKLFDTHGPNGRQLVLKADHKRKLPERLGWVHSACAYGIASSRIAGGCVFGCLADGTFEGDGSSDDEKEMSSDEEPFAEESEWIGVKKGRHGSGGSPPLKKKKKSDDDDDDSNEDVGDDSNDDTDAIHHFVICGKEDGQDTYWTNTIKECRSLRCFLCGNSHCPPTHIPLQCCANDPDEFFEHKPRHRDKSPCFTALHVGCARGWDSRFPAPYRRIYFFPGSPGVDDAQQPVNELYCSRHAKEVHDNAPKRKKQLQEQLKTRQQMARSTRALSRTSGGDTTEGPVALRRASASTKIRPTGNVPALAGGSRAISSSSVGTTRKKQADAAKRKMLEKDWFEDIRDDVVTIIKSTQNKGGNVIEATNKVKAHWKDPEQRSKMGMTKRDFNAVWERVKDAVSQMPELMPELNASTGTSNNKKADASAAEKVNPWGSIWELGGKKFEFGDWDTLEEISS